MLGDRNKAIETSRTDLEDASTSAPPLVMELNAICKTTTLGLALSVGELVVRRLYAGDVSALRSRERKRDAALRKVATHPALAMSPSMLYECIAIYEICERLDIRLWKHVSTSHLRLVLPLAPCEQDRLLHGAESERWSVRRLEQEIVDLGGDRAPTRARGGRKRQSRLRKAVRALEHDLDAIRNLLGASGSSVESSPESSRAAMEVLGQASDLLATVKRRIHGDDTPVSCSVPDHLDAEDET
jgi:hypothetical protein